MSFPWTCPFCGRDVTIVDESICRTTSHLTIGNSLGYRALEIQWIVCPNPTCKRFALVAVLRELVCQSGQFFIASGSKVYGRWLLIPESSAKVLPDCVPEAIRDDYVEACRIVDASPKASATLARRVLQGMIRDFWKVTKSRLKDEIDAIKDKVDPDTWDGIEAVRKVGNIGAHMEKDIDVIVDVDPGEAEKLIGLVEMLIDDWYVSREKRKQRLTELKELAQQKEDQKKQSGTPALAAAQTAAAPPKPRN